MLFVGGPLHGRILPRPDDAGVLVLHQGEQHIVPDDLWPDDLTLMTGGSTARAMVFSTRAVVYIVKRSGARLYMITQEDDCENKNEKLLIEALHIALEETPS